MSTIPIPPNPESGRGVLSPTTSSTPPSGVSHVPDEEARSEHKAAINGVLFPYAPTSVRMNFRAKVHKESTLGGKVVQVFGTHVDSLTVQSAFIDAAQQRRWYEYMRLLAEGQSYRDRPKATYTFSFPHRGWEINGYIQSFTQVNGEGGNLSVHHSPRMLTRQFRLVMGIQDDPEPLRQAATDQFIRRLADGFGWEQTIYNGPLGVESVEAFLNGATLNEYIALQYLPGGFGIAQDAGAGAIPNPGGPTTLREYLAAQAEQQAQQGDSE